MQIKNIKETKIYLRSYYKKFRLKMNKTTKEILDYKISERFLQTSQYKNSKIILIYVSKEIEVDTYRIIEKAFEDNKSVAVPKCDPNKIKMNFYLINSLNDLEVGIFGVLEPIKSKCKILNNYDKSICVVPGFSFDQEGYRLGYGKGYYDRFLSSFHGLIIGLCYSNCIRKLLPRGYYDLPVHLLITDKYLIDSRG